MAIQTIISIAAAIIQCDDLTALVDADALPGYVEIRSGTKPANPGAAPGDGAVLALVDFNDPAFGAAQSAGAGKYAEALADVDPDLEENAIATDTATWFRVYDGADVVRWDGTVGTSSADMIVNTTSLESGQPFRILSWAMRQPTGEP
jgi:hypothetical protein